MDVQNKLASHEEKKVVLLLDFESSTLCQKRIKKHIQVKKGEPRVLYPAKMPFKYEGHRHIIINKQELGKDYSHGSSLRNLLENKLQVNKQTNK